MDQLFQVLHKNGQVWYFRSREEMRQFIRPQDCEKCEEIPVTKLVIAIEDMKSPEGDEYSIAADAVYPVVEEFTSRGDCFVLLPMNGHSVAWLKNRFNERYLQSNTGGVN